MTWTEYEERYGESRADFAYEEDAYIDSEEEARMVGAWY